MKQIQSLPRTCARWRATRTGTIDRTGLRWPLILSFWTVAEEGEGCCRQLPDTERDAREHMSTAVLLEDRRSTRVADSAAPRAALTDRRRRRGLPARTRGATRTPRYALNGSWEHGVGSIASVQGPLLHRPPAEKETQSIRKSRRYCFRRASSHRSRRCHSYGGLPSAPTPATGDRERLQERSTAQ